MALTKHVQIDVVSEMHNETENVAIHLADMVGAFEVLGIGGPAKKLRKESDRLFNVSRKLLEVLGSMVEETEAPKKG